MYGAGDGVRTRDMQLGKLPLYQLSYARVRIAPEHSVRRERGQVRHAHAPGRPRRAEGARNQRDEFA